MTPLEPSTQDRLESRDDLQQAHATAAADVEGLARRPGCLGGEQVGLDDVVYVGEVAGLRAVAVHFEPLAAQTPLDEARDHRRVLRFRVLPGAEDVEVAEPDGLDAVEAGAPPGTLLPRPPGHPPPRHAPPRAGPPPAGVGAVARHP